MLCHLSSRRVRLRRRRLDRGAGVAGVAAECSLIIYLGDTARVPYGSKSPDTIRRFATEDTQFLVNHAVKAVVVACTWPQSTVLPHLQATFVLP